MLTDVFIQAGFLALYGRLFSQLAAHAFFKRGGDSDGEMPLSYKSYFSALTVYQWLIWIMSMSPTLKKELFLTSPENFKTTYTYIEICACWSHHVICHLWLVCST